MNFEMGPNEFLDCTARLLALASLIHGYEFLTLRKVTAAVWTQDTLADDLLGHQSSSLRKFLSHLLRPELWNLLNVLRIGAALGTLWSPDFSFVLILLICHLATLLRWRGSFNGGSDSMLLYVFFGTVIGMFNHQDPMGAKVALWFVALTLTYSYVKPGLLKLNSRQWRNSEALRLILDSPQYQPSATTVSLSQNRALLRFCAWSLIGFEVTFPLAFFGPNWAMGFLIFGLCFHIGTTYVIGLNRFLIAWICAYPALFYCAT